MLFKLIPAILSLVVFVNAGAQSDILYYKNAPPGFAKTKITKHLLKEDMQVWQKTMEESHVNPYHAISPAAMQQLQKNILDELPDSVTHFEASFAISRLIGALDEGHLGFSTNRVSDSMFAYHSVRFPYQLYEINDESLVVQRDLGGGFQLPAFSRIIEVNGVPVKQLYDKYSKLFGGLEPWRKLMVKNYFRKLLYLDGLESPFKIKAINGNDTLNFTKAGYTFEQTDSLAKVLSVDQPVYKPFSFRFLENNIALIEFNTMNGKLKDSFSVFLRDAFTQSNQKKANGLIIDIRKNGGGDSGLGDTLLSYITNKPYRNTSGMKLRISKHSKAIAALLGANDPFKDWENGKLYEYNVTELKKPADNPLRYNGQVVVLIGTGTFSSANMLTNAIKDYQLATLVGETTAEPANDFGEIMYFMLPNTYIVAPTAIKMFMRANGDEKDFDGIKPDIEVANTSEDFHQERDRVLETAINWFTTGNACENLLKKHADWVETPATKWDFSINNNAGGSLFYFGAIHSDDPKHEQINRIKKQWELVKPTMAFFEGPNRGIAETGETTIEKYGESGYVRFLADKKKIPVKSLEPGPMDIYNHLVSIYPQQQVDIYMLTKEAMRLRTRKEYNKAQIESELEKMIALFSKMAGDKKLSIQSISELQIAFSKYWPGLNWWEAPQSWFDPLKRSAETGGIFTNDINTSSSAFRDLHMLRILSAAVQKGERVFAVVGRNHVPMQVDALACMIK